jgi:hypothetical protein
VCSYPTRMPSSISVGDTRSPNLTTNLAICLTLMTYLLFSGSFSSCIILVHRATWSGCSSCIRCRSAAISQRCGGASPVSDSFTPVGQLADFLLSVHICPLVQEACPKVVCPLVSIERLRRGKPSIWSTTWIVVPGQEDLTACPEMQ